MRCGSSLRCAELLWAAYLSARKGNEREEPLPGHTADTGQFAATRLPLRRAAAAQQQPGAQSSSNIAPGDTNRRRPAGSKRGRQFIVARAGRSAAAAQTRRLLLMKNSSAACALLLLTAAAGARRRRLRGTDAATFAEHRCASPDERCSPHTLAPPPRPPTTPSSGLRCC